jgi:hypothetical protein
VIAYFSLHVPTASNLSKSKRRKNHCLYASPLKSQKSKKNKRTLSALEPSPYAKSKSSGNPYENTCLPGVLSRLHHRGSSQPHATPSPARFVCPIVPHGPIVLSTLVPLSYAFERDKPSLNCTTADLLEELENVGIYVASEMCVRRSEGEGGDETS